MRIFKKLTGYVLAFVIIAAPVVVYAQRQEISDWWRLKDYSPPSAVSILASQTTMTDYSRHVFYVNHPKIEPVAASFRADCRSSEQTIVLGCYHGDQQGIYIYDINDQRLFGVEQVTAAHEMLHAAYDRLDEKQKQQVNAMLEKFYRIQLNDERIKSTINSYKMTEPTELVNEMHSIFATEVMVLPPELENYYSQYFSDRSKIVGFAQNYQNEFTKRQNQINAYDAQLKELKAKIDKEGTQLELQLADLQANKYKIDNLRNTAQFDAYDAAVPGYNIKVVSYNNNIAKYQADIVTYNNLIDTRNSLAKEIRELDQALDTRLQKQQTQ